MYDPIEHVFLLENSNDLRYIVAKAAYSEQNQRAIRIAPLTLVLASNNTQALKAIPFLEDALRFVHLEAGHAAQNLILQAVALGVCTITSYRVGDVYRILGLSVNQ